MELFKDILYYSLTSNGILYAFYIWIASIALFPIFVSYREEN